MFAFGDKVRDPLTGYQGVVTVRAEYISGSTMIAVENEAGERWFYDSRLEIVRDEPAAR